MRSEQFEQIAKVIFQRLHEQFGFARVDGSQHYPAKDSGIKRQIDITVYHIDGSMIIIECKLHKVPIDIGYVDAFHTVIHTDVGADKGIMLSSQGFTRGAICSAQAKHIELATLKLNESATEDEHQYILKIGDVIWNGVSFVNSLTVSDEFVIRSVPIDNK